MKLSTRLIGAAALFGTGVFGQLPKTSLWGGGISSLIDPSLWAHTGSPGVTWANWIAYTYLPERCYAEAQYLGLNPWDFVAFTVKYDDCGTPWQFCWHVSAPISQGQMVDLFGRLPVRERQWVQHVMAAPASSNGWAYNRASTVVFVGAVGVPSVFQHEVTHSLDSSLVDGGASNQFYWLNTISADSCVPDDYSNRSPAEDFAQIGVVCLFNAVTPGGMDGTFGTSSWKCLLNQFNYWNTVIYPNYIPGGTCTRSWTESPAVSKSTGQQKRSEGSLPREEGGAGQPPDFFSGITYYDVSKLFVDKAAQASAKAKQEGWAKDAAEAKKPTKRSLRFLKPQENNQSQKS